MISETTRIAITVIAAFGAAVVAGIFFAFSAFIMRAFSALHQSAAVAAMQSVNRTVICTAFMVPWVGTGLLGLWLLVLYRTSNAFELIAAGASFYLLGVIGITLARNVPLNERLAKDLRSHDDGAAWQTYARPWTAWNSVRTFSAAAASLCFSTAALMSS